MLTVTVTNVVLVDVVGTSPLVVQHRTPTGPSHVIVCTCIGV